MGQTQFDWRWLVLVVIVLIFFGQISLALSPLFAIVVLSLCAWWMFQAGLRPWRGLRSFGGSRETYWRGQRVRIDSPRRSRLTLPTAIPLASSICYLAMGACLVLAVLIHVRALLP